MNNKKSRKIFNSLTNVRDEFIYEAQEGIMIKKNNSRVKKMKLLTTACFVFILFSVTILASTNWGTYLIDKFTSRIESGSDYEESGFDLKIEIEIKPVELLTGEVQKVPNLIIQQFENTNSYSSWYPGHWQKNFSSSTEAIKFIGLKELMKLKWELNEDEVILDVLGNEQGKILSLRLETRYKVNDIRLSAIASIFTENEGDPITYGARTTENVEFEEIYYETANQLKCHIISASVLDSGYLMMDGFLVKEGILYNLHIAYQEKDKEQAEELLYQWADLF